MVPRKMCCKHNFVADILFTDEVRFTRNGNVKRLYTHTWVKGHPHATLASRYQHRFYINIRVEILGIQLRGLFNSLPNRLTGAEHHLLLVNDLALL
jgi:hypothetical protein